MRDSAVSALKNGSPKASAARLLSPRQTVVATVAALIILTSLKSTPLSTLIGLNILATGYFLSVIAFRLYLAFIALDLPYRPQASIATLPAPC